MGLFGDRWRRSKIFNPSIENDAFVVLNDIIPPDFNSYGEAGRGFPFLGRVKRFGCVWHRIPPQFRMIIMLLLTSALILGPPILAALWDLPGVYEYRLDDWKVLELGKRAFWTEYIRWALLFEISLFGLILTHYTSIACPKFVAFLAHRLPPDLMEEKFLARLETIAVTWPYIGYTFVSLSVWICALEVLPHRSLNSLKNQASLINPNPKNVPLLEMPLFFFLERGILAMFIWSTLLALEKCVLHMITRQFNDALYRERILRHLYSLWAENVLRKAGNVFSFRPRAALTHPHFSRLWTPRPYPYADGRATLAKFLVENFFKLGAKSAVSRQTSVNIRRIFRMLSSNGSTLTAQDLIPYFFRISTKDTTQGLYSSTEMIGHEYVNHQSAEEAEKNCNILFTTVFDPNRTGSISCSEFSRIITEINQECNALVRVLFTNSKVLLSLDRLLLASILVPFTPLLLLMMTGISLKDLPLLGVSLTSLIVSVSMIFGESIKSFVAAIIFLFVTHPYDVGDRVYLSEHGGVGFFVRKMHLLSTTFERFDGYIVSFPNSLLATMSICNVRRTGSQAQAIEIIVPANFMVRYDSLSTDKDNDLVSNFTGESSAEENNYRNENPNSQSAGGNISNSNFSTNNLDDLVLSEKNSLPRPNVRETSNNMDRINDSDNGGERIRDQSTLAKLNQSLVDFVKRETSDFVSVRIVPSILRDNLQLHLLIIFWLRSNFQDGTQRSILCNKFVTHLRATLESLGLEDATHLPIRPVHINHNHRSLYDMYNV